jgi:hypothetical protein
VTRLGWGCRDRDDLALRGRASPRYTSSVHSATSGDEARRIPINVARLPQLLEKGERDWGRSAEYRHATAVRIGAGIISLLIEPPAHGPGAW